VQKIKCKQLDHLQHHYCDTLAELLTGIEKSCKTGHKTRKILTVHRLHHPRADTDHLCSQKREMKRTIADRRVLHGRNY
jgi:hypothetical protein